MVKFYYTSNEESPLTPSRMQNRRKGKKTKLSTQAGYNTAQFSTDMKYYMKRYTNLNTPIVITLNDNKGKVLTTLVDNQDLKDKIAGYAMPQKEFFHFPDLRRSYPQRMDDETGRLFRFPEISGTDVSIQRARLATGIGYFQVSWETYMASQDYIVVCVDGRGTGGRGAAFEQCTYLNLGVKEAHDQVETALYMGSLPYVDKNRIGIWGWSFGGYMTLMSMSEGTHRYSRRA